MSLHWELTVKRSSSRAPTSKRLIQCSGKTAQVYRPQCNEHFALEIRYFLAISYGLPQTERTVVPLKFEPGVRFKKHTEQTKSTEGRNATRRHRSRPLGTISNHYHWFSGCKRDSRSFGCGVSASFVNLVPKLIADAPVPDLTPE